MSFEVSELEAKADPYEFVLIDDPWMLYYPAAGHFVRWLLEVYGVDPFREVFEIAPRASGDEVLDVLESVYGQPAAELFADYDRSAPYMWIPHRQCADLDVLEPEAGVWEFESLFDCDDTSTFGPYERWSVHTQYDPLGPTTIYQSFLIDIQTPGTYRFERELDTSVEIERCVEQRSLSEAEAELLWQREGLFPTLQGTTDVELHTGTYRVDVRRQFAAPHPVWVRIVPG